ncbi:hypothetical protein FNF31_00224 [Cafeteria roenbergensis]|uniref:DNA-directed DNA polymerase family A palm domain-containing protein n=2 Tax=Cafeteria roenbergensis TaxID=33653 RepID=A0A5A8DR40_CAFRO|nr:hypothetical protein FNF28_02642 [Cafeteria roenbergensis]KAA0169064.1 hypothetical protein FNF31_00224 [Cafeteria roenbergensis]
MVRTVADAERVVALLGKVPDSVHHAWDTEVSHIDVKTQGPVGNGRVICASFYCGPEYDFGAGPRVWVDNLGEAEGVLNVFADFLKDPTKKKAFHNVSFDRHVLYNHGIDVLGLSADTMHMARMWTTSRSKAGGYGLESLSADLLGHRKVPMKERFAVPKLKKDGTPGKDTLLPPVDEIQLDPAMRAEWIDYSTYDAEATWRLREVLADKLRERPWAQGLSMLDFYERYIVPFAVVLTDMEREGIRVDVKEHLPRAQMLAEEERATATEEFLQWAEQYMPEARRMNTGSDPQKAHFLFAPCVKAKGRTPRARDAARKRTLAKFGIRRPEAGHHPRADPERNEGVLTWEDWREWVDPEGSMFGDNGEWEDDDAWPPLRPFKVENTEGVIEEGRPRAKKQRDLWVPGLGLEPVEYTAGGWPAASAAVLRSVAGDPTADPPQYGTAYQHFGGGEPGHKACSALHSLVTVGAIDTMLSNFILPLQTMADEHLRVHCSLNLNTDTGRLSARRPNLQNQPALEKDRYQIRKAFCAAPGNKLVIADYGQLELRVLAHMARCKSMIDAFASGGDFHSRTAMGMYDYIRDALENGDCLLEWDDSQGARPKPLLKNQFASERRKAKVLNFSIAYGKTPIGLSQDWGVSLDEAKDTLEKWYSDRPEVRQWQEQVLDIARSTGATRTLMGRYRDLPEITSPNRGLRGHAERAAINTPIQGGAADVVMMAMLKIAQDKRLAEMGYKLILQIHDEVILEGPEEHAEEAMSCLVEDMEHPFAKPLLVDLIADAAIANTWYEGK